MTYRRLMQGTVFLVLGLAATPSWPQAPGQEGPALSSPPVIAEEQAGEQSDNRRHFEAKRRERLIQMLQLDDATRAKLLQRLEQFDQKGEELRRQRREAFQALREQAKTLRGDVRKGTRKAPNDQAAGGAAVDNAALKAALERVYSVEESMAGLRRERFQIMRDLLTPEQQVKFLIYTIKFHKEMRERLERERSLKGKRGQPEGGGADKP